MPILSEPFLENESDPAPRQSSSRALLKRPTLLGPTVLPRAARSRTIGRALVKCLLCRLQSLEGLAYHVVSAAAHNNSTSPSMPQTLSAWYPPLDALTISYSIWSLANART